MGIEAAIIGSAVLGAGTSLYGASKSASASKDAAKVQQQANDQAIQFQREQRGISQAVLQPYVDRGNQAFGLMAPHLGMGGGPPRAAGPATGLAEMFADPNAKWQSYTRQYKPEIDAFYRQNAKTFDRLGRDPIRAAEHYYNTVGSIKGHQMPTSEPAAAPTPPPTGLEEYQTPGQAQEEAWNKYRTETTYGKIGDYYADKAGREFMDLAGSSGSALSGRTARGMAEVGNEAAMANFQGYMGMLGGINDQGYNATTGIASAGQNFANNASQLTQASGQAAAAGKIGAANAWVSGLSDLAGWGGWAAGQFRTPSAKQSPAPLPQSAFAGTIY